MFDIQPLKKTLLDLDIPLNLQEWVHLFAVEFGGKRDMLSNNSEVLTKALHMAIKFGVIGVSIPSTDGGLNLNYKQQHYYYRFLAQISGTFAVFSTQFTTALANISASNNIKLKQLVLENLDNISIGLATNHLKNFNNPMVVGRKIDNGYIVNGTVHYVSGHHIFNKLMLGFVGDNEELFALIDFKEIASFQIQPQANFIAANSTNTVNCILNNYTVDESMMIAKIPLGSVSQKISKSTRHLVSFQIGLACSILDLMHNHVYIKNSVVTEGYNYLTKRLLYLNQKMVDLSEDAVVIPLRTEVAYLLNQIFFFADQIFKGAATISSHPYILIKNELQVMGAIASSEETLIETCKYLLRNTI